MHSSGGEGAWLVPTSAGQAMGRGQIAVGCRPLSALWGGQAGGGGGQGCQTWKGVGSGGG